MATPRARRFGVWSLVVVLCALLIAPAVPPARAEAAERSVTTASVGVTGTAAPVLRRGSTGDDVRRLQKRLNELGYWIGTVDGSFGDLTEQAVVAFQKVNGLTRDGVVGSRTRAALKAPVRPRAQSRSGRVVEVDRSTQVLMTVRDGRVRRIFNTSTGAPGRTTPAGRYRVTREIDGWRRSALGSLYRPKYFHGGIALHGYTSVPPYPASHGCVRVSLPAMDTLWSRVPVGRRVWVY